MIYYCSELAPFTTQHAEQMTKLRKRHDDVTILFLNDTLGLDEYTRYFNLIFSELGFELPYIQVSKTDLQAINQPIYFDGLLATRFELEFPYATFLPVRVQYGYEDLVFSQTYVFDDVVPSIAQFIVPRQLFGITTDIQRVYDNLSYGRFKHSMRVRYLITQLARIHKLDVESAQFAALFHDYAKEMSTDELKAIMMRDFSEYSDAPAPAWHGFAGAVFVEDLYGPSVHVDGIYEAIAFHSVGVAGFVDIGLALFIADFCDYRRDFADETFTVWELAQKNLSMAALAKIEHLRHYFATKQQTIYRTTEEMAAWLVTKR